MADDVAIESITDRDQIRMKLLASGRGVHAPLSALDDFYQAVGSYQPLDADLTSWAAVVRAAGLDAFVADPSSANFATLLTDESGTGKVAFVLEGTWTPVITASAGTFTTVSATGGYTKIGRLVTVSMAITITTVGTASGIVIATLPLTANATGNWLLAGRESLAGKMLQGPILASGTTASIINYDNTSAIGAGAILRVSGSYWV